MALEFNKNFVTKHNKKKQSMERQSDNSNERIEFILLSRGKGCQVWKLQIHALKVFLKKKQNPTKN